MTNKMIEDYNWKGEILDAVMRRKTQLEMLIGNKEASVQKAPEGSLRVADRKKYYQYYRRTDPKDTIGLYIKKRDHELARQLAQKDYDREILNEAKRELVLVNKFTDHLQKHNLTHLYDDLKPARKVLVDPIYKDDERYVREWRTEQYAPLSFEYNTDEFIKKSGVRVRSKSELIIANMLEQYEIPYRYEYPLRLRGKDPVRPDFLCLNIKQRREYIWEHFGMMDSIAYANRNIDKIAKYELSGYHAGKNMIMTFETSQVPVNSNIIKSLITEYLI